ncbi:hypothetical protein IU454_08120 [Nocardia farcinica]|uniref:hypothetical protein n=1 Tax=Nocardia farcinica TaxID=37329 RepID=UPI001894A673|nr:hypothetical protein [Nocardia farcinica]MBF6291829.1 hypothetical protein [Nocardia farcinica]
MPRSRTIKPGFWDSPDTAAASLRARLLYIAMWTWADDYGIGDATPSRLIAYAFPHDNIPADEHQQLIADVVEAYGVVLFEHDARRYFIIPSFAQHQPRERKAKPRAELMEAATRLLAATKVAGQQSESDRPSNVSELPSARGGQSSTPTGSEGP